MTTEPIIPDFLKRKGQSPMAQTETQAPDDPAPAKKQKRKMVDAYVAHVKVTFRLNADDDYQAAKDAINKLKGAFPANATVETSGGLSKVPAE